MKKILFILMLCISGFTYSQNDTTNYEDWRFHYLVYPNKYDYVSIDELHQTDDFQKSFRVTYKTFVNISVLDTINIIRLNKGHKPILYDTSKIDGDIFQSQMFFTQDYAKEQKRPVYLVKDEDPTPECNCVTSVVKNLFDDSLLMTNTNLFTRKETVYPFKDLLLKDNIKDLRVFYFQTSYRDEARESLYVYIKKKRRLLGFYYYLINEEKINK